MPHKKLTYFNGRGRGEVIRMILHSQKEKFDDERINYENWATIKPTIKYGQVPVFTLENGVEMNESMAIARYLARKAHLCGKDEWEMYLVDRAVDTLNDLYLRGVMIYHEKDEKKKGELLKELKEKQIPQNLGNLCKYIEEGKGEFLAGSSPTFADIFLCSMYENVKEEIAKFPELENIYKKTLVAFPGIKAHIDTRPETRM